MTATGGTQTNITANPARDQDPAWSPNGARIAFASDRAGNHLDIWTMNADGTGLANLTPLPDSTESGEAGIEPSWSPDGSRIAYSYQGDVWVMNSDGSSKTNLTHDPALSAAGNMPAWSPDGSKIAYVRGADVWPMNSDGSGEAPLTTTTGAGGVEKYPDWSPDGTRLTYERSGNIWRMRANGTQQKAVTAGFGECGTRPAWSAVGTRIVFSSQCFAAPNGPDIFTVRPDGTAVTRLATAVPGHDLDPAWQPIPTTAKQQTYLLLRATATATQVNVSGELFTAHPGRSVTVTLSRLVSGGSYQQVDSKAAVLDGYGAYATTFPLPDTTSCRVTARFPGDTDHKASTKTKTFAC